MAHSQNTPPRNVLPELIIPAMALIFAVYYLSTITQVPWIAQASALAVSILLFLSIAAFAIRTVIRVRRGTEIISVSQITSELSAHRAVNRKRLLLFGVTIGYVALLPLLGFSLATFILIFSGIIILTSRAYLLRAFVTALICTTIGYLAFIQLFKTRFPSGPVENLLKGLF